MNQEQYIEHRVLKQAIYGCIVLAERTALPNQYVAIKKMSIVHMERKRAIFGPNVSEDGKVECTVYEKLMEKPHRHILSMIETHVCKEYRYLVLQYCANGELYDRLETFENSRFHHKMASKYTSQIASGLNHLHGMNIAHRDVSLENVLLDGYLNCQLCDFGLASLNGKKCSGKVGKPFYMAPEVYDTNTMYDGCKADSWSLGIMVFIMLTGVPPVQMATMQDPRFKVLKDGVRGLLAKWKFNLKESAIDFLEKTLVVDPNTRWSVKKLMGHSFLETCAIDTYLGSLIDVKLYDEDIEYAPSMMETMSVDSIEEEQRKDICTKCQHKASIFRKIKNCNTCNQHFCKLCVKKSSRLFAFNQWTCIGCQ